MHLLKSESGHWQLHSQWMWLIIKSNFLLLCTVQLSGCSNLCRRILDNLEDACRGRILFDLVPRIWFRIDIEARHCVHNLSRSKLGGAPFTLTVISYFSMYTYIQYICHTYWRIHVSYIGLWNIFILYTLLAIASPCLSGLAQVKVNFLEGNLCEMCQCQIHLSVFSLTGEEA